MPQITKPNTLNKIWASGGDKATPLDGKINSGWQIEIPPRQWFNWLDNRQDQAIAHINQHGIAVWDNVTEYQADKSYVQDPSDGVIYRCLATNVGNLPSSSPAFWTVAFADAAGAISESQADAKYLAKSSNLADLPNKNTARNNLSVYSRAEVDNRLVSEFTGGNRSTGVNGFQRLPGGLLIQWGSVSINGNTPTRVTFPTAFPANVLCIVATDVLNDPLTTSDNIWVPITYKRSRTQFDLMIKEVGGSSSTQPNLISYIAIGI